MSEPSARSEPTPTTTGAGDADGAGTPHDITIRRLLMDIEPLHAVTYFAPECHRAMADLGLSGFWMGYVAGRAAPMGPVEAPLVTATFANFAPRLIERAVPEAWRRTTPEAVLTARATAAAAALRAIDPAIDGAAARVLPLLEGAARAARCDGRPLAAANQAVAPVDDPVARLWQAATTLREHRGDGHVAALVAAGISGLEAHVLLSARRGVDPERLRTARGWEPAEWAAAQAALVARGWLHEAGHLTVEGELAHEQVERATDRAAQQPYADGLTETGRDLLRTLLRSTARTVRASGLLPFPNPMGLPDPDAT